MDVLPCDTDLELSHLRDRKYNANKHAAALAYITPVKTFAPR